jgi:hypothetical protein
MTAAEVGRRFGTSRQAVQKRIDAENWTKTGKVAAPDGGEVVEVAAAPESTTFDNQTKPKITPKGNRKLTEAEWLAARTEWEDDERKSPLFIAEKYGVPLKTVKDRITTHKWTRRIHKQLVHIPRARPPWRPTQFREEFTQMLIDYFKKPAFKLRGVDEANGIRGCIDKAFLLPMLEDFAESIGVHPQRLYEWATRTSPDGKLKHPDFADALDRARNMQDITLVRGGIAGVYNGTFAVMAARNRMGWRNEVEVEKTEDEAYPDRAVLDAIYAKVTAGKKERDEAAKNRVIPDVFNINSETNTK